LLYTCLISQTDCSRNNRCWWPCHTNVLVLKYTLFPYGQSTISHCTWMNNHSIVNNIMWQAQFFSCNNKISFINFLIYLSSQTSHYL
jgi:hypothetical protein